LPIGASLLDRPKPHAQGNDQGDEDLVFCHPETGRVRTHRARASLQEGAEAAGVREIRCRKER
jgi:hypothetical protein